MKFLGVLKVCILKNLGVFKRFFLIKSRKQTNFIQICQKLELPNKAICKIKKGKKYNIKLTMQTGKLLLNAEKRARLLKEETKEEVVICDDLLLIILLLGA